MNPAGNIREEMEEIQKLLPNSDESIEMERTQTIECGAFLTLICC